MGQTSFLYRAMVYIFDHMVNICGHEIYARFIPNFPELLNNIKYFGTFSKSREISITFQKIMAKFQKVSKLFRVFYRKVKYIPEDSNIREYSRKIHNVEYCRILD